MVIRKDELLYYLSSNGAMNFLKDKNLELEYDLMRFSSILFNIETLHRMGYIVKKIRIPVTSTAGFKVDLTELKKQSEQLLNFVLMNKVDLEFDIENNSRKFKRDYGLEFEERASVCLFSGGIDSYSGILKSSELFSDLEGVFVLHGDQPKGVPIIKNLEKKVLANKGINVRILYAPPMKRFGYSQLRGFLYCMYGSIYVSLFNAKNLLITECGPTMYQSKFSPYDSVTMTTHPYVLGKSKHIIELFLNRSIKMITPFENLTKSEVFAIATVPEKFPNTHSCISMGTGRNCGHCYGCVVRRLGSLVAGIKDAVYDFDPITKDFKKADNLISLLRFSFDILVNYTDMNFTSKENIYIYKKQRLFRRFALDNFAAIYLLKKQKMDINPFIENLYAAFLKNVGEARLKKRIEDVRNGRYVPNFDKTVKQI